MEINELVSNKQVNIDENRRKCLKEISEAITKFLKDNGGYGNGCDTYLCGDICYNTHWSIKWKTPTSKDFTGRVLDSIGYTFNESLIKILNKYSIKETVKIVADYQNGGYWKTKVVFELTEFVNLLY